MSEMNRRSLIKGIGAAICAGYAVPFVAGAMPADLAMVYCPIKPGSFEDMLNEYLPTKLLKEEILKPSWLIQTAPPSLWLSPEIATPLNRKD